MKVNMTVDTALEHAKVYYSAATFHEGSEGWRVVCMVLAQEVERLLVIEQAASEVVAWCDKNPPAGDALYCVSELRESMGRG